MFNKRFTMVLLAATATVSMAGCAMLPTSLFGKLSQSDLAAAQAMINDSLVALQTDADMSIASVISDDASYATMGLGDAKGAPMDRFKERAKPRLEKARGGIRHAERSEDPNDRGGKTGKVKMDVNGRHGNEVRTVEKVVDADGKLVEVTVHFELSHKNGMTLVSDRHRKLGEDGAWTSTFKSVFTRKDGKTKTVEWSRVEAADGTESGQGTITRFDGSVVTIAITKSADGTVVTKVTDSRQKVDAELTQGDTATDATVVVTDGESGQTEKSTIPDTEAVEPSEQ
ncbi:MAG TPA: hypothetical protein V6D00_05070 [Pantanalinema sp.]